MRRREFIAGLGSAAAWPVAVRAQQPAMPVVGFLNAGSPDLTGTALAAFRKGMGEAGYIEGKNVAVEYRWAENQIDRLPALAADLVSRRVAVIVARGSPAATLAAKAATTTIPIVFVIGGDPVELGIVRSINRPGGNVTGVVFMNFPAITKRLGLLHEMIPTAVRFTMLVNPGTAYESDIAEARRAAFSMGGQVDVLTAATNQEIDEVFASLVKNRSDALLLNGSVFFANRRVQIVTLAARHAVPTIYYGREFPESGGLMSYGSNLSDVLSQAGAYAGRVLKGEKPADLPVMLPAKFEFVVNLQTAKTLGLTVPPGVLAIADEVIE